MAKTIENDIRPDVQEKHGLQEHGNPSASSLKSKTAQAKDYLDTFYPGWDIYLKNKR